MNLPSSPRPPKWPYLLGDALLLALACSVGLSAESPFSPLVLSVIFGCVALGCVLAALPYLFDFFAEQRATVLEFQRKLEAQSARLAHDIETLAAAGTQLKAAQEAAAKAVHTADALPYKLQEKIAEFTAQLQQHDDEEKAAMTKELEALRDTEGQRLTALVGTIQTATKEFAALEKEARAATEAARHEVAEAAPALAAALGAATTRAEAALNQSALHAQTAIAAVETKLHDTIAAAEALSNRLLERTAAFRQLEQELDSSLQQRIDQLNAAARAIETAARSAHRTRTAAEDKTAEPDSSATDSAPVAAESAAGIPVMQLTAFPRVKREPPAPRSAEPAPETDATPIAAVEVAPAADAPATAEPAASAASPAAPAPAAAPEPAPAEAAPKREPRRKSSARTVGEAVLPGFAEPEIVYDAEPAAHSAPAKSSDGSTRLLVTAYIGIGNKVFVRGEGPGLSWEKGVPMEFVSIGKWSWKASDDTAPVKIQLYKNDDLAAQGDAIAIPAGHHVEATPVFREPDPF